MKDKKDRQPVDIHEPTEWTTALLCYDPDASSNALQDCEVPLEQEELDEVMEEFTALTLAI
jgi:hypothetical protein